MNKSLCENFQKHLVYVSATDERKTAFNDMSCNLQMQIAKV